MRKRNQRTDKNGGLPLSLPLPNEVEYCDSFVPEVEIYATVEPAVQRFPCEAHESEAFGS